jgi:DNA repair photolyase
MPAILAAARDAGAQGAGYTLLRLPLTVRPVFLEWLARTQPDSGARIEARIRSTRSGKLNSSVWGERMSGTGAIAEQIGQTFKVFRKKHGLDGPLPSLDCSQFRPPRVTHGQLRLF